MQVFERNRIAALAGGRSGSGGFTMVEIALSLAVVAFALVAIIGVLPTGMTVEKDNREDTLINQEGRYWLEAIKTGARGLNDITNYVEHIKIERMSGGSPLVREFNNNSSTPLRPTDVIGLVSMPKYRGGGTNRITARLRPITGAASEKGSLTNEITFRYQMQVEITEAFPMPLPFTGEIAAAGNNQPHLFNIGVGTNLWDVRLVMRWPVVERGDDFIIGNNRKTFRGRVAAQYMAETNLSSHVRSEFTALSVLRLN